MVTKIITYFKNRAARNKEEKDREERDREKARLERESKCDHKDTYLKTEINSRINREEFELNNREQTVVTKRCAYCDKFIKTISETIKTSQETEEKCF